MCDGLEKLEMMLCGGDKSLLQALEVINENAKGFVFVVGQDKQLIGILTDGDIRRLLLKGSELSSKVGNVANKNFVYATTEEKEKDVLAKLSHKIKIIPIIDNNRKIVDYAELKIEQYVPIAEPALKGNEFKYLVDAFLSTWISSKGEYIQRFENEFSDYCNCEYGVAVSNGTVALQLALLALGVQKGDEVIVPDLTFAATINSVLYVGATPVIVDIEEESWDIDPQEIEKAITSKTKAIIPVHIYGQPCNMQAIMEIAEKHNLYVIEDCAEAHGAEFAGKKVGSFGDIGCFSFFGNKVITTGEGGMCITKDKDLYEKMLIFRDHGMSRTNKYWHDVVGYNFRMTNLQAAIGVAQLEQIEKILFERRSIEEIYREKLEGSIFKLQNNELPNRNKITWMVSALVDENKRSKVFDQMTMHNIETRPFFYPLSEMDIYKEYLFSNKISRKISAMGLNFPTKGGMDLETFEIIASIAKSL